MKDLLDALLIRDGQPSYRRMLATIVVIALVTALLATQVVDQTVWSEVVKWAVGIFIGGTSLEHAARALRAPAAD